MPTPPDEERARLVSKAPRPLSAQDLDRIDPRSTPRRDERRSDRDSARALIQLAIGLPIGLLGAVFVGWALQSLVVQTSPIDPLTLGTIVAVLAVVAVVACVVPAQRAARLDPMVAFRVE